MRTTLAKFKVGDVVRIRGWRQRKLQDVFGDVGKVVAISPMGDEFSVEFKDGDEDFFSDRELVKWPWWEGR